MRKEVKGKRKKHDSEEYFKKTTLIYIIKELVLKQCSKFYASGGNVANLKRITGLPKTWGQGREKELKIKIRGGGGGHLQRTGRSN